MTFDQAIAEVENRPRNINLQWFISKWNDGYIIHPSSYIKRHPETQYVYSTGDINRKWFVLYNEKENKFKHFVL